MKKAENPLFINTVCLGGTTDDKLRAAHDAGFQQVELWRQDVEASGGDTAGIKTLLQKLPVGLTDYQVLLDFDGAPDSIREDKRHEALRMLDTAVALGATLLLTPACTHKECVGERIEEDLRWLARQAGQRGLRIAYEGMAWSTKINNTADAWKMVQRVNEPNLGLVVDAFHIFVRQRTVADLHGIPMDKIFLVQLSDLSEQPDPENLIDTARHRRLLPGQGKFPIHTLIEYLQEQGYTGPLGLEVFSDVLKAQDPASVARQAMKALQETCFGKTHQFSN
ncbi:sugar phosphate isomerase/epimerase family protein [Rouxiella badensis]|uniref:sugar phosphate isomerase/epimerase family protein n=1 Tax=Rouxiella badensis TaxID=1646377 RepID=UPI00037D6B42|nr:sugar phosphate isomerase/epimerase family protein [Rouxiella badensis]MCC3702898.1 sugar phosphate isomerase/epimerase [Rouxiella badensis]MCC3720226.1 sugar phosphate isomerase/epimerase [Rouxiella badensis]MCC3729889.1 sugar phosphate isomerase/epimerase [Rouxiella badensis]MCC3733928.1 sugar phosphate isomerase/epimerase [Rouxiella badensis]MCC3741376.1 sugar phosphate isomerase/epimerase [Rouxiella badensis]